MAKVNTNKRQRTRLANLSDCLESAYTMSESCRKRGMDHVYKDKLSKERLELRLARVLSAMKLLIDEHELDDERILNLAREDAAIPLEY